MCHIRNLTIAIVKMFLLLKFHSCLQSRMSAIRVSADVLLSVIHTKTETERHHLLSRSGWCPMRTMKWTWSKLILQEQGKTSNSWNSASPKKYSNHLKLCVLNTYRTNWVAAADEEQKVLQVFFMVRLKSLHAFLSISLSKWERPFERKTQLK